MIRTNKAVITSNGMINGIPVRASPTLVTGNLSWRVSISHVVQGRGVVLDVGPPDDSIADATVVDLVHIPVVGFVVRNGDEGTTVERNGGGGEIGRSTILVNGSHNDPNSIDEGEIGKNFGVLIEQGAKSVVDEKAGTTFSEGGVVGNNICSLDESLSCFALSSVDFEVSVELLIEATFGECKNLILEGVNDAGNTFVGVDGEKSDGDCCDDDDEKGDGDWKNKSVVCYSSFTGSTWLLFGRSGRLGLSFIWRLHGFLCYFLKMMYFLRRRKLKEREEKKISKQ